MAKNKRKENDEGDSGGEEEDDVTASCGKRGRSSGSGSDSNKVGYKISQAIAESRIVENSSDRKKYVEAEQWRLGPSGACTRVKANRAKAIRTY